METGFPIALLLDIICVYGDPVLVENDTGKEPSKPFNSMDKLSQFHEGEGDTKV